MSTTSTSTSTTSTSSTTTTTIDPWAYVTPTVVNYLSQVQHSQLQGISSSTELFNFIEDVLVPKAEGLIDTYVGRRDGTLRHFNPHDATWTVDGIGKKVLFMPPKYSPMFGTLWAGTISGVGIPTLSDIKIHPQWVEYENGSFAEGALNVTLSGYYGYATVPHDVQLICGQICANILLDLVRRNVAPDVFMSLMQGGGDTGDAAFRTLFAQPTIFTNDMRKQLDKYRIYWTDVG